VSLRVEDLTVYYQSLRGDVKAVDGATFEIADGEIMGLAGESGCGKSTLGKSLIRFDARMRYVGGRVTLDGVDLPIWSDAEMNRFRFKDVSIIPQYALSALNPTRRIGSLAKDLLAARDAPVDRVMPEFKRRLDLVGLGVDVLERFPIELSGGMKQRVVMVLSSLLDPSLLIADEVTSALDVSTQRAVSELLVEFRDRGFVKSIVVITHDLSVLYQIADTVLVMYAGKLAEKARAEEIVESPKHPYTKLLLSSLPEVGVRYEEQRLHGIPGRPPSLLDPPAGCRFKARCPLRFEKCEEEPPFVPISPEHSSACWAAERADTAEVAA
jgi:peptide/nickel transport system ATP-binding protein